MNQFVEKFFALLGALGSAAGITAWLGTQIIQNSQQTSPGNPNQSITITPVYDPDSPSTSTGFGRRVQRYIVNMSGNPQNLLSLIGFYLAQKNIKIKNKQNAQLNARLEANNELLVDQTARLTAQLTAQLTALNNIEVRFETTVQDFTNIQNQLNVATSTLNTQIAAQNSTNQLLADNSNQVAIQLKANVQNFAKVINRISDNTDVQLNLDSAMHMGLMEKYQRDLLDLLKQENRGATGNLQLSNLEVEKDPSPVSYDSVESRNRNIRGIKLLKETDYNESQQLRRLNAYLNSGCKEEMEVFLKNYRDDDYDDSGNRRDFTPALASTSANLDSTSATAAYVRITYEPPTPVPIILKSSNFNSISPISNTVFSKPLPKLLENRTLLNTKKSSPNFKFDTGGENDLIKAEYPNPFHSSENPPHFNVDPSSNHEDGFFNNGNPSPIFNYGDSCFNNDHLYYENFNSHNNINHGLFDFSKPKILSTPRSLLGIEKKYLINKLAPQKHFIIKAENSFVEFSPVIELFSLIVVEQIVIAQEKSYIIGLFIPFMGILYSFEFLVLGFISSVTFGLILKSAINLINISTTKLFNYDSKNLLTNCLNSSLNGFILFFIFNSILNTNFGLFFKTCTIVCVKNGDMIDLTQSYIYYSHYEIHYDDDLNPFNLI